MSRITPLLYLGDINDAKNFDFMKARKVSLIVNCAAEIPNYFPEKINYIRMNWNDDPSQEVKKDLLKVTPTVLNEVQSGRVVFIHCAAGISRSATVMVYAITRLYGWNLQQALNFVKKGRGIIRPNEGFMKQLIELTSIPIGSNGLEEDRPQRATAHSGRDLPHGRTLIRDGKPLEDDGGMQLESQDNIARSSNLYGQQENDGVVKKENFKSLTFDCPNCDLPEFEKTRRGIYAKIF